MKKGIALALALLATAVVAASAQGSTTAATASQAVNCNGTMKIGIMTPLTGGGGFIGQEQLTWARYALSTLPKTLGLKIQLVLGDTPVEQGGGAGPVVAQKMISDPQLVAVIGPATSGRRGVRQQGALRGGYRAHLAVRDAHLAHPGLQQGGDAGILPRHPR